MNYHQKFLSFLNNYYVIKPSNPTKSWLRNRKYIHWFNVVLVIKTGISSMVNNRQLDALLGEYFWIDGRVGRLLQTYVCLVLTLALCYRYMLKRFDDSTQL